MKHRRVRPHPLSIALEKGKMFYLIKDGEVINAVSLGASEDKFGTFNYKYHTNVGEVIGTLNYADINKTWRTINLSQHLATDYHSHYKFEKL